MSIFKSLTKHLSSLSEGSIIDQKAISNKKDKKEYLKKKRSPKIVKQPAQTKVIPPEKQSAITLEEAILRVGSKPKQEFIFRGIPHSNSLSLIVGSSKVGKTIFVEGLCYNLLSKTSSYLGSPITDKINKIMLFNLEEYIDNRVQRNIKQVKNFSPSILKNLIVMDEAFPRHLQDKESWTKLSNEIEHCDPDLIIIDSLSRLYSGDLERRDKSLELTQKLRFLIEHHSIPIIIIHHSTKLNGQIMDKDKIAGSSALIQDVECAIGLGKLDNGTRYMIDLASRYKQEGEDYTCFEISEDCILTNHKKVTYDEISSTRDRRNDSTNRNKILDHIALNIGITTPELQSQMESQHHMKKTTFYENFKKINDKLNIENKKISLKPEL